MTSTLICRSRTLAMRILTCLATALCAAGALSGCDQDSAPVAADAISSAPRDYVGSATCAGCHEQQQALWESSHHAAAMQPAAPDTVLGDFTNARFTRESGSTEFSRDAAAFSVRTPGADGRQTTFPVRYTFGVDPLQQYLLELPDGRLQAFDIAWDTRPAAAGGQRWFDLRAGDAPAPDDPLHWTGLLQNWNAVCADCHSTNLQKNYAAQTDRYDTGWTDISVGCEACHGPGSAHVANPQQVQPLLRKGVRPWQFMGNAPIAQPAFATRESGEIEACAPCHSRRSQQTDDVQHGDPLLDGFRPALLEQNLYFPDGQIRDEVFVYGSFIQSRMHRAGVTCSDCHEPHTLRLKSAGNGVCAQCHQPAVFDAVAHHQHPESARVPRCVDCHMPATTYMAVDSRRDHSFRVPRPDLTTTIGAPNACGNCHEQSAEWAAARVAEWFPDGRGTGFHYGQALHAGQTWAANRIPLLRRVIDDPTQPGIVRATAIRLYMEQPDASAQQVLGRALADTAPLPRLAALDSLGAVEPQARAGLLAAPLQDPRRIIRTTAAQAALPVQDLLDADARRALASALQELGAFQQFNFDRPEGLLARAELELQLGRPAQAEQALRLAISRYPGYVAPYINLADLFRATGRDAAAVNLLRGGLRAVPDHTDLLHALGLALVRTGASEEALTQLAAAAAAADASPRYGYVYGVALSSLRGTDPAVAALSRTRERFPGFAPTLLALATISRDAGRRDNALAYTRQLLELMPGNPDGMALLAELE